MSGHFPDIGYWVGPSIPFNKSMEGNGVFWGAVEMGRLMGGQEWESNTVEKGWQRKMAIRKCAEKGVMPGKILRKDIKFE